MKQLFLNKNLFFLFVALFIVAGCSVISRLEVENSVPTSSLEQNTDTPVAVQPPSIVDESDVDIEVSDTPSPAIQPTPNPTPTPSPTPQPQAVGLIHDVPFTSQAPFQVWDELHGEACEEASMLMAVRFLEGVETITPHDAEQVFIKNVRWQEENGYSIDLTVAETQVVLRDYFNTESRIITDVSVDKIIELLNSGSVIIVPAGGRLLGNPYFQNPGPIYHMLVIKGYDKEKREFITNDPGTKRGENFRYSFDTLINAIHDWDHALANDADGMTDADIASTPKRILAIP